MSDTDDIERVVASLRKVPEKRLLIIDLANRIPRKGGEIDYDAMAGIQPEVNLAITEAKMYGAQTLRAVASLKSLVAREEVDV